MNGHAGAIDFLLGDEEVHQSLTPLGGHLAEPETHEAAGAATGLRGDGDSFARARQVVWHPVGNHDLDAV
jgi:hypothetical protein